MRIPMYSIPRLARATMLAALAGAGCAGEPGGPTTASGPSDAPPPPPMVGQDAPPPPPAAEAPAEQPQLRPVIGQTTTEIRDFDTEMQRNKNVRVAEGQITAKSPITLPGNAYVTMTGKIGADYVQHAIDLYHAEHGRYPETTEEFVSQIMKPNNLELPQLPAYQQYAYKPDTHELVVLEYPDRMESLRKQVRGEAP